MGKLTDGKTSINIVQQREDESKDVDVASYPVESGSPISDHVQDGQRTLQLSGFLLGDSAERDYNQLFKWQETGILLTFYGRIYLTSAVISNLTKGYETIENGFEVSLSLTFIRQVKSQWVKVPNKGKQQTNGGGNAVYVTVKPGNTYWGWWQQYGTAIQTLRNWNGWPDRRIPIGARARVK